MSVVLVYHCCIVAPMLLVFMLHPINAALITWKKPILLLKMLRSYPSYVHCIKIALSEDASELFFYKPDLSTHCVHSQASYFMRKYLANSFRIFQHFDPDFLARSVKMQSSKKWPKSKRWHFNHEEFLVIKIPANVEKNNELVECISWLQSTTKSW